MLLFPCPSSGRKSVGWVPGDLRVPDQLHTRNRGEERMSTTLHSLPWTCNPQSDSAVVNIILMCKQALIYIQVGIVVENSIYPTTHPSIILTSQPTCPQSSSMTLVQESYSTIARLTTYNNKTTIIIRPENPVVFKVLLRLSP